MTIAVDCVKTFEAMFEAIRKLNEMGELKFCPFCKNVRGLQLLDTRKTFLDRGWVSYFINCPDCGTCGPEADTPEEAIAKWNRRAEVEALEVFCRENKEEHDAQD